MVYHVSTRIVYWLRIAHWYLQLYSPDIYKMTNNLLDIILGKTYPEVRFKRWRKQYLEFLTKKNK